MPHVLTFQANEFLDAQEAALQPTTDLVVVEGLVDPFANHFNDNVPQMEELFADQTPVIQEYWDQNRIKGYGAFLKPWSAAIQDKSVCPHIDAPVFVGYIASANLSTQERLFYARRTPIPDFLRQDGKINNYACTKFNEAAMQSVVPAEDWTIIKPGSVALFGAMPHLATHAARGNTYDATLHSWATHAAPEEV